jgi:hypothetical protein
LKRAPVRGDKAMPVKSQSAPANDSAKLVRFFPVHEHVATVTMTAVTSM